MHPLFKEYYTKNIDAIATWQPDVPVYSENAAIIIENRNVENFGLIVKEHMRFLEGKFMLVVFCGKQNEQYITSQLKGIEHTLFPIPFEVPQHEFLRNYNEWLGSYPFWNKLNDFGLSKVLMFQTDSLILRKGVDEFLKFCYCGALWPFVPYLGNGGFSMRSVEKMRKITHLFDYIKESEGHGGVGSRMNEDSFFCNHITSPEIKCILPTRDEAMKFSVETLYGEGSFGCHAISEWLDEKSVRKILGV